MNSSVRRSRNHASAVHCGLSFFRTFVTVFFPSASVFVVVVVSVAPTEPARAMRRTRVATALDSAFLRASKNSRNSPFEARPLASHSISVDAPTPAAVAAIVRGTPVATAFRIFRRTSGVNFVGRPGLESAIGAIVATLGA